MRCAYGELWAFWIVDTGIIVRYLVMHRYCSDPMRRIEGVFTSPYVNNVPEPMPCIRDCESWSGPLVQFRT